MNRRMWTVQESNVIAGNVVGNCRLLRHCGYSVRFIASFEGVTEDCVRRWTRGIGTGRNTSLITSGGYICC